MAKGHDVASLAVYYLLNILLIYHFHMLKSVWKI